jgi:hypothetical protein
MEQENLNKEQISTIAELLGQKANASYCTMDAVAKNITAFLYVMLGRTFEGNTINYQCVVDALKELPASAYKSFHTMITSVVALRDETQKLNKAIRMLEKDAMKYGSSRKDLLSILHKQEQRAVMFEHLFMQQSQMGQIINQEISSKYKVAEIFTEDGREWSEIRTTRY